MDALSGFDRDQGYRILGRPAAEGSPVIDPLRAIEAQGVHLILCQTCLAHYNLTDKVQVGVIGGMGDIIAAQVKARKVITL